MCIGVPMVVIETDGLIALCQGRGESRRVNVMLVDSVEPGCWVLTSSGNARRLLDPEEAALINEALDALAAALNGESLEGYFADIKQG
jgi:hydrogenase assembly chaperone HypC/HupF